jgi:hypothetical protein
MSDNLGEKEETERKRIKKRKENKNEIRKQQIEEMK